MPLVEVQQNTPEWLQMRIGCVTASRVADVVTKLKSGKYSAARDKYLMEVVVERLTGRASENYVSPSMEYGLETEPLARAAYEIEKDVEAQPGGLAYHPSIEWFAASPDALVGGDGLAEFKCPNTSTHLAYLIDGVVPLDYMPQMLAQMACTERKWCDFVSYDPRLPQKLQYFCRRFDRNDEHILLMEKEVKTFLDEVIARLADLAARIEE
jgi:putative phage-type endonuclease